MKRCCMCGEEKPYTDFNKWKNHFNSRCKRCQSDYFKAYREAHKEKLAAYYQAYHRGNGYAASKRHYQKYRERKLIESRNIKLQKAYGITTEQKQDLLIQQNNRCALCNDEIKELRLACVDHHHITGKIRELLCGHCNKGLGYFRENISVLEKVIAYLKKHNSLE